MSHNVVYPADAVPWVEVLFGDLPPPGEEAVVLLAEAGPAFFEAALDSLAETGPDLPALAREIRQRTGRKGAALYMPLRAALTGRCDGPELGPLVAALGTDRLRERLGAHARPYEDRC